MLKLKRRPERMLATLPIPVSNADDLNSEDGPYWDLYRDGVTQGLLGRFNACPERHRLHIVEGLSPIRFGGPSGVSAMDFGSLIHDTLDHVYTKWSEAMQSGRKPKVSHGHEWLDDKLDRTEKRDIAAIRSLPMAANPDHELSIVENFGIARVLMHAYLNRWSEDFGGLEWLALERQFRVPYPTKRRLEIDLPDIPCRGKRDGEFRAGSKRRLHLFETKTKARIEEEQIVNRLGFDLQVMFYLWSIMFDYNGEIPEGVMYNVIRRPQLRRGKNETVDEFVARIRKDIAVRTDFYFVRYSGTLSRDEFLKWMDEFDAMMWRLVQHYEYGRGHFRDSGACAGRLGVCEYLDLCGGAADLSRYARRPHCFPELDGHLPLEVNNP